MSGKATQWGLTIFVIAVLLLSACGGSGEAESAPTEVPATQAPAATATPLPTQAPTTGSESPAADEAQPTATEPASVPADEPATSAPAEEDESEVPFNVPVMEGATDLVIQRDIGSVTYVMKDAVIGDVVDFYKTEMTAQGWAEKTSSTIGLMATLVFETDQARTSVSLQANEIAETVSVRLFISAR